MSRIGPYSRPHALAKVDGRTREARLMQRVRAELVSHVGNRPSATEMALIDRAAWLSLHVAQLDARAAEGRAFTEHDARTYLAWSNSLARTLRQLGLKGSKASAPARSLAEHLAEKRAAS
jgi:hypothetical protein